ncbi:MAG: hypothetical protein C5B49_00530 [Bdellovibrio sp.]|nr:MAG: hypothetical protein C5B49_00530 [Bdellovibrio sp.]
MKALSSSRRHFLQAASKLTAFGLGSTLTDSFVSQLLGKAIADSTGAPGKNLYYLGISLAGGLPRWQFDLPLQPTADSAFQPGKFGTVITGSPGSYATPYVTKPFQISATETLNLPPVWFMNFGGMNFTDLLANMAMFRGVDMQINSHPVSNQRQEATNLGGFSLGGVVADATTKPIPAITDPTFPSGLVYRSATGKAALNATLSSTNPAALLLNAFQSLPATANFAGADWKDARNQALSQFELYAQASGLTDNTLAEAYANAEIMMNNGTYQLSNDFPALYTKYLNLVTTAIFPAAGTLTEYFPDTITVDSTLPGFSIDATNKLTDGINMWSLLVNGTSEPQNLAKNFALAELMFNNDLTGSLMTGSGSFLGINTGSLTMNVSHDHHYVGQFCETLLTTLFYRALLACLVEFKNSLGAKFDNTVIHIAAEWNRSPAADGHGSDHGVTGSNVSIISGMIKGPVMIGNILVNSGMTAYPGTWGVAAPWQFGLETRTFVLTDITRTLTSMMGVKDIVNNGYPLLAPDGTGKWVASKTEAKNV